MAMRFTIGAAMSLAGGCQTAPADKVDTGTSSGHEACVPGTPPSIDSMGVTQGQGTDDGPSILVQLQASDEDGDLHDYQVQIWFDDEVDGAVDRTSYNRMTPGPVSLDVLACGAPAISSEVEIVLLGEGVLNFDTVYEFAAVITDASGLDSAPALSSGKTPREG